MDFYRYGDQFVSTLPIDPATGEVPTQRLQPGVYSATAFLDVAGSKGAGSTGIALVGDPQVVVSTRTSPLDARDAERDHARTPRGRGTVLPAPVLQRLRHRRPVRTFGATYAVPADVDSFYAAPTGPVRQRVFDFAVRWRATEPALDRDGRPRPGLDPVYQSGRRALDGRVSSAGVEAGTGTADEYAGVDVARQGRARPALTTRSAEDAGDAAAARPRACWCRRRPARHAGRVRRRRDLPVVSVTAGRGARSSTARPRDRRTLHRRPE